MSEVNDKKISLTSLSTQLIIIAGSFVIMGFASYFYTSSIVHEHMKNDAQNTLTIAENNIISSISEYEILINGFAETIKAMIRYGIDDETLSAYMTTMTDLMLNDDERKGIFDGTQGYFTLWGGKYFSWNGWVPTYNFVPQEQAWYITAVENKEKTIISNPYVNTVTGNILLPLSRCLCDEDGTLLGVICLNLILDKIVDIIYTTGPTKSSYGLLLNNRLQFIAHPNPFFINTYFYEVHSGVTVLTSELEAGLDISERKLKNFQNMKSFVFFRKTKYDLYLGLIIPIKEYNRNTTNMGWVIGGLGFIFALVLCAMMYHISQEKIKSDIRTQQKSNFLATMSHEIRTPLNAILGVTDIQMQNTVHPPETSEAFLRINNSGNFLLNIINDILDLSKIESGKMELITVKYEVASLINDITQLNYIRYESKPIEFIIEIGENIPSILIGDELRIKQILNNLLSNAFKYTDTGEVIFSINAEISGRGGAALVTLVFNIRDTGHGMTQDEIKKLFDEYSRFNLEANRATIGTGLGMTITRNLIKLMNGNIHIKSAPGEGTHVTVHLPQKTDGLVIKGFINMEMAENLRNFKSGNAAYHKKAQIVRDYMPYGSVLVVDDVETNLYVAKGLMAPYGLKVDVASSGFEAIDKVKKGGIYDIIFMDHMMPKMDGIEAFKILREMNYMHPVVALTANALSGQIEVFQNSGFDGFLSKPIDIRHLNITLNTLIRDKQPFEALEAAQKEKEEQGKIITGIQDDQQTDSQLAGIFARDAEKSASVLEDCLKNNLRNESDIQLYIINIHAMKSALANIGRHELSSFALKLEEAGRVNDINTLLSESAKFLEKLHELINEIKSKTEDNENQTDTEDMLLYLKEKLTVIKTACENFDRKAVKNTLNELREKPWSKDRKNLINTISEHLLHSEFDDIISLAGEEINQL